MTILSALEWLASTQWSIDLHESQYVWPFLESLHVLCLTLFVGTTVMLDLRLLGVAMTHIPASEFTDRLLPWTRFGFAVMVITGVLLFTATPVNYYQSLFFRIKVILLVIAGFNVWYFHSRTHRRVGSWDLAVAPPRAARVAAIVSLLSWSGVVIAGRLVAYNWFECGLHQQAAWINWAAGCVVPTAMIADLLPFFEWCEATSLGQYVRTSVWLFPVIESIHLLGLSALGGAVLLVDLRMLGLGLTRQPIATLSRAVQPWLIASIALMVSTGFLLFMSEAVKCYNNPSFWVKIEMIPIALLYTFTVRRRVASNPARVTSNMTRVVATVSLLLWFTVAAAGRWIGFSS